MKMHRESREGRGRGWMQEKVLDDSLHQLDTVPKHTCTHQTHREVTLHGIMLATLTERHYAA